MAAFTAADVKALREKTGAGMMDAKKALEGANGDIEAAVDALRADRCLPAGWGCGRKTTARVVELRRARSEAL